MSNPLVTIAALPIAHGPSNDPKVFAKAVKETCANVLRWADTFENSRVQIGARLQEFAAARASIEGYAKPEQLAIYSSIQGEIQKLLAKFYLALENINVALNQLPPAFHNLKLVLAARSLDQKIVLDHDEVDLVQLFLSPRYRLMFDYDTEIEKLNDYFDELVQSKLRQRETNHV